MGAAGAAGRGRDGALERSAVAQAEDAVGEVAGGTVGEHIDQIGGFGASRMRGGLPRASSPVVVVA